MTAFHEFLPKSYLYLRSGYSTVFFKKDLLAGLTVAIIALPLAMAFAIASGVAPEKGLITAIIAGFLISALGGSRVQIGGPTGAFVVIVYGIIQRTGYEGLAVSTLIASALLLMFGLFRLGSWIKYVPHPLITGFTTGIAVIIFSSQMKDFFGLKMGVVPADFVHKWIAYFQAFNTFSSPTLLVSVSTLGVILFFRKFVPKIPWGIAAIVIATSICVLFQLPVETIQSKFGEIPRSLPWPELPSFSGLSGKWGEIFTDGVTIAFLGAIESLLSAVIADGMIGGRHKSNCELIGQGIANFFSVLFGGIPATGAIARTAANVKTGAETPVAGMLHAVFLFLIILFFAPIVSQIPLAALSAVLVMVAWNMSEIDHFVRLFKAPFGDVATMLTAFLLTVFVDITVAISLGMVLASFFFMKKMSEFSKTVQLTKLFKEPRQEFPERTDPDAIENKIVPPNVEVYEINGPFFFGVADMLKDLTIVFTPPPKVFILRMRHVPMIDASGMHALKEFFQRCQREKTTLLLSGVHGQTAADLKRFGLTKLIGEEHIFPHIDKALARAAIISSSH
ncbi:MAG: sodium-independent anion transporter [Chlamydiae bacterium RIFCSPHIGHO2_12_FULL_49_9]|nr:MAG: sodium-independent anion transporter [Chlamydiae bacterium RIFCSPHIGHO2_12_FULL_49_9]